MLRYRQVLCRMNIRIIGPCGSGKSTAAKMISSRYGIPCYELDHMVWDRSTPVNRRYPKEIRDALLKAAMLQESWVIEGVECGWSADSFREADLIFILKPHVLVRDYRILRRFVRSRTGIEPWNYKQTLGNLWTMLVRWNHGYDWEKLAGSTAACAGKCITVTSGKEILEHIEIYRSQARADRRIG